MTLLQQLLISQFEASLSMLAHCIVRCPAECWQATVVRYPFSQVVFHTLFYADFYLGQSPEGFESQPFHLENKALFGDYEQLQDREPIEEYERADLERYLGFVRAKAITTIQSETEHDLAADTVFPRRRGSRAEAHVYNVRHIQHHVGQLTMRLRLNGLGDLPWVGHGWREP
jgi:uncharacterized damage-inducible protein DinB